MCVEGTRAKPLYCKYVAGTVADTIMVWWNGSQEEAAVRVVVNTHADCFGKFKLHFTEIETAHTACLVLVFGH